MLLSKLNRPRGASLTRGGPPSGPNSPAPYPVIGSHSPPLNHPVDAQSALSTMMSRLNTRPRSGSAAMSSTSHHHHQAMGGGLVRSRSTMSMGSAGAMSGGRAAAGHVPQRSTSSLRALKLRSVMEQSEERVAPTF
ncbi:cytochrome b5-like Heme/Steroid binding domain-containing protein [Colletotrichum lupini]|nr:cytochrome b5-like Heme/Steroid binding domain-containing protein [Colletotrichum lupini]UQC84897.1 cytochrome b5-like Heme/Steroid binding domain-containing protein [Colletotrichum lupini]